MAKSALRLSSSLAGKSAMLNSSPSDTPPSSPHIRVARALLDWSQGMLAQRAGVSPQSVQPLEVGALFSFDGLEATQRVLASEAVRCAFTENGGGIRLIRRPSEHSRS